MGQETGDKGRDKLRERAISVLLSSKSFEAAAKKLRVSRRTVYRWMTDESFQKEYREAKKNLLRAARARLTKDMLKASEVLHKIATSKGVPYQGPRVSAAIGIIRLGMEAEVIEDLEERILALERQSTDAITVD